LSPFLSNPRPDTSDDKLFGLRGRTTRLFIDTVIEVIRNMLTVVTSFRRLCLEELGLDRGRTRLLDADSDDLRSRERTSKVCLLLRRLPRVAPRVHPGCVGGLRMYAHALVKQ